MADSFRLLKPGASRKRENDTPGEREGAGSLDRLRASLFPPGLGPSGDPLRLRACHILGCLSAWRFTECSRTGRYRLFESRHWQDLQKGGPGCTRAVSGIATVRGRGGDLP